MRIVERLDPTTLFARFQQDHDICYIGSALACHRHCFLTAIDQSEFQRLLVNSSPQNLRPPIGSFPTIEEVVDQIRRQPTFLEQDSHERVLNGMKVKYYLELLKHGSGLKECFIRDKEQGMPEKGSYYVADGMHSLVAYALWTDLKADGFPVKLYLCTNSSLSIPAP